MMRSFIFCITPQVWKLARHFRRPDLLCGVFLLSMSMAALQAQSAETTEAPEAKRMKITQVDVDVTAETIDITVKNLHRTGKMTVTLGRHTPVEDIDKTIHDALTCRLVDANSNVTPEIQEDTDKIHCDLSGSGALQLASNQLLTVLQRDRGVRQQDSYDLTIGPAAPKSHMSLPVDCPNLWQKLDDTGSDQFSNACQADVSCPRNQKVTGGGCVCSYLRKNNKGVTINDGGASIGISAPGIWYKKSLTRISITTERHTGWKANDETINGWRCSCLNQRPGNYPEGNWIQVQAIVVCQ